MNHSTSEAPRGPETRGLVAWAGLAVALAALALFRWHSAFLVDDAFITFRYARNWAEWGTPVFSSFELAAGGQPVEGYSNFLWMAILAGLHALGLDLEAVAPLAQLAFAALSLGVITAFARRLRLGVPGVAAAPLLLSTAAPFVAWSAGGMETTLFTLVLLAFFCEALREPTAAAGAPAGGARAGLVLGLLGAAVVLVRAEGALWVLGTLGAVAVAELCLAGEGLGALAKRRARIAVALAACGLALAGHLAWRRATYGEWLPNTVHAKSGGAGVEVWSRGWRQVLAWALVTLSPLALLLLAAPALLHRERRARVAVLAALLTVLGFVLYNVATGGDWMPFFRFLAPAAPMVALVLATGVDRLGPRVGSLVAVALVTLQPLALHDVHVAPLTMRESLRFRSFKGGYSSERGRIEAARANREYFTMLGHALAAGTSKGDVLGFGAIGSPGWYAQDLDFLDRNGLMTPIVARREVERGRGTAGHEKRVPHAWFLDHGSPAPNLLFASWRDGRFSAASEPAFEAAKRSLRQGGMTALKAERELFTRTVMRAVPVDEGPAAGRTLIVLQRASPEAARAFWR